MWRAVLVGIVCCFTGFLAGWVSGIGRPGGLLFAQVGTTVEPISPPVNPFPETPNGVELEEWLTLEERTNILAYDKCNRSVVNIQTKSVQPESFFSVARVEGSGSGSVLDQQGHILTNYHVIEGARDIVATLYSGQSHRATIIGIDPDNDIAVIKIEAPPESLFPIEWGDASRLKVGQRIYAIGNPFGFERTMSTGIISSLNRQLPSRNERTIKSVIQIDAALNQGNSGGPLINSQGRLIGMNTAIATSTGDNAGIGFAIPATTLSRVVPQLIQNGRVTRPVIGIEEVYKSERGLLIVRVTPGGPAEQAGLQGVTFDRRSRTGPLGVFTEIRPDISTADLIEAIDGRPIQTADDLLSAIEEKQPGDRVRLTVVRQRQRREIELVLAAADGK
jgi:S1-C subfamily serine protease